MERFRYNTDEDDDRTSKQASKPTWDGTLDTWPAFEVSLKSHARKLKLYNVMTKGVVSMTTRRLDFGDEEAATDPPSWWVFTGMQAEAEGPYTATQLARMLNRGAFNEDAQYQGKAPLDTWRPMDAPLRALIDSEATLGDIRAGQASNTPATHKVALAGQGAATPFTQAAGAATAGDVAKAIDSIEASMRTNQKDEDCYDMIIGCISLKTDAGKGIVLKIDKKFAQADNLSGHELYRFLAARDKFDGDDSGIGGIVDADSIQRQLEDFKLPSGEMTLRPIISPAAGLHGPTGRCDRPVPKPSRGPCPRGGRVARPAPP